MEQVWTHRDEQLRRMQTDILDFEDIEEQLNLNQFTLDDFRAQLLNYLRQNEAKLRDAPLGLYAVTAPLTHDGVPVNIKPGVIFCLKQTGDGENSEDSEKLNPIHPYYLVHISDDGEVSIGFTNPKRILERFSTLCVGKTNPDQDLCNWFNEETDNGNDMTIYEMLLDTALKFQFARNTIGKSMTNLTQVPMPCYRLLIVKLQTKPNLNSLHGWSLGH